MYIFRSEGDKLDFAYRQDPAVCDILQVENGWITCPVCRRNHRLLRIRDDTQARRLPVFCRTCRTEILLNIERGQSVKRQSP